MPSYLRPCEGCPVARGLTALSADKTRIYPVHAGIDRSGFACFHELDQNSPYTRGLTVQYRQRRQHYPVYAGIDPTQEASMHPSTEAILRHFSYEHLPPKLAEISKPMCELAYSMASKLEGPELTAGLRRLLEAKDCFVRAALESRPTG